MLLALTKQDNIIRLESRHLKISSKSGSETDIIPVNLLDRVILTEPSRISGAVMQQLLEAHIPVILIGKNGKYLGQMHYTPGGDCQRRRLQAMLPAEDLLQPAINLLDAKLYNQKRVLQRLAANRRQHCPACRTMERLRRKLPLQKNPDQLKGIEGLAAHCYFEALSSYFPEWCAFSKRCKRPAMDPANALLSYSYAIMTGEMENLIRLHALDPAFGFLHCKNYDTPALALDLLEPFRPGYCDMLVINLLTHHHIRREHFAATENGIRLTPDGRRIFFRAWEEKRARKFKNNGILTGWQNVWDLQVRNWLKFLTDGILPSFFRLY